MAFIDGVIRIESKMLQVSFELFLRCAGRRSFSNSNFYQWNGEPPSSFIVIWNQLHSFLTFKKKDRRNKSASLCANFGRAGFHTANGFH